jgi:hypothetical protein
MSKVTHRFAIGFFSLGMTISILAVSEAADLPPDVLTALIAQDVAQVNKSLENLSKSEAAKKKDTKSPQQIQSSAMMLALYAQSKISGKEMAVDAKYAGLRDQAVKVAEAVANKKVKDAEAAAKNLSLDAKTDGKASTSPLTLHELAKFDIDVLMAQYKKIESGGLGVEKDIKDGSKKLNANKDKAATIAARVWYTAEYLDKVEPSGGFSNAKPKATWTKTNSDMRKAAEELLTVAKEGGKPLQAAFAKVDRACSACHNTFKE